jgi:hypothetical protein
VSLRKLGIVIVVICSKHAKPSVVGGAVFLSWCRSLCCTLHVDRNIVS